MENSLQVWLQGNVTEHPAFRITQIMIIPKHYRWLILPTESYKEERKKEVPQFFFFFFFWIKGTFDKSLLLFGSMQFLLTLAAQKYATDASIPWDDWKFRGNTQVVIDTQKPLLWVSHWTVDIKSLAFSSHIYL